MIKYVDTFSFYISFLGYTKYTNINSDKSKKPKPTPWVRLSLHQRFYWPIWFSATFLHNGIPIRKTVEVKKSIAILRCTYIIWDFLPLVKRSTDALL